MKYLRNAMRKSKKQKPPSLYLPVTYYPSSTESSPRCSSVFGDSDADDEGSDLMASVPLSLAIPGATGPYCPRRPTLREVLSNTAPPPWTLGAFMAYLSQNHCLETLEFTMDASRYRKHYNTMLETNEGEDLTAETEGAEYVRMLWQKLLDAYLTPNGPREVNLPSNVRDHILTLDNTTVPPHPETLDNAVKIIYELMNESVLIPFLNTVAPLRGPSTTVSPWTSSDDVPEFTYSGSADDMTASMARHHYHGNGSPPLASSADGFPSFKSSPASASASPRQPRSSNLSAALRSSAGYRLSHYLTGSTVSGSDSNEGTLTDDSRASPTPSTAEPMTPPTTPPTSDNAFNTTSPSTSPKNTRDSGWKNLGMKLGWKKSRSAHGSTSSMSSGSSKYPVVRESITEDQAIL